MTYRNTYLQDISIDIFAYNMILVGPSLVILAKLLITVPVFAVPGDCWPPLFLCDTGPPTPGACRQKHKLTKEA